MFTTCSAANRIIQQPLLTKFTRQYVTDSRGSDYDYFLYTRIRNAQYSYIGCTKACAVAKAKELNLLYNRYIVKDWYYNSDSGEWRPYTEASNKEHYTYKQCGMATVTKEVADAYSVNVQIQEELTYRFSQSVGVTARSVWSSFEANPDLETPNFKTPNGITDFEYDGII